MKYLHAKQFLVFLLGILCVACSKSDRDDDDTQPVEENYRLKEMIYYDEGSIEDKTVFFYENERITRADVYTSENGSNLDLTEKIEVNYQGESMVVLAYSKTDGSWSDQPTSRYTYTFSNGRLSEYLTYDKFEDGEEFYAKLQYSYSGNNLIESRYYSGEEQNNLQHFATSEFTYENGKVAERRYYSEWSDWNLSAREVFSYLDGRLISCIEYDDFDEQDEKCDYSYSNDLLTRLEYYYWSNNEWNFSNQESFSYDQDDYLVEINSSHGDRMTYAYEQGKGNIQMFMSFPETEIYAEPKVKTKPLNLKYLFNGRSSKQ